MRDFLNAPNSLPKQTFPVNERQDADILQSPLGGRTVWQIVGNDANGVFLMGQLLF